MSVLSEQFKCQQCGACCEKVIINVAHSDIIRWLSQRRLDILQEISFLDNYPKKGTGGFYIRKTVLNPKQPCPFLSYTDGLSNCSIHKTKPRACKDAPLGYDTFSVCSAFDPKKISQQLKEKVKKSQYEDFRLAHANQGQLLALLTKTRREWYG